MTVNHETEDGYSENSQRLRDLLKQVKTSFRLDKKEKSYPNG